MATAKKQHPPSRARKVDWFNPRDFDVVLLGALGFSNRLIHELTALSNSQIYYRLKKAEVRRMDYRNGDSEEARSAIELLKPNATKRLYKKLDVSRSAK